MSQALGQLAALYPLIGELPQSEWAGLLAEGRELQLPAQARVFDEHQACQGFPFVLEGMIRVAKSAPNGRELPLYRVAPGETCIISSSCLLGRTDYNAHGITEVPTRLLLLPSHAFEALLAHEPFRRFVFNLFAERIADLMQLVEEVAFRKLDQRLAAHLLGHGTLVRVTHQQLADELGSVREIVSRLLKNFAAQGLVHLGREQIEILDPAGLRKLASP